MNGERKESLARDDRDKEFSDAIRQYLHTDWAGSEIIVLREVDSTNDEAKRRALAGAGHGLLVAALRQTAGRGRFGHAWESREGSGVFMSLLLRPQIRPAGASMLTLVMALAVRSAIGDLAGIPVKIKWPNDIVCSGKKLVGILTEMSIRAEEIEHIVVGVGINIHNEDFPQEIGHVATSVYQQSGMHISRARCAAEVLNRFEYYYGRYLSTQDLGDLMDEYNANLINFGREVRVRDPRGERTGTALGIDRNGELLVRTGEGMLRVAAGEVSVRGVCGYV